MKFLANENFPKPALDFLREKKVDIIAVAELYPGITDEGVMNHAIQTERTIVTHDSDYGELIFKHGYKPSAGVIYLRIYHFEPEEPGSILLDLINQRMNFKNRLTVITNTSIRQRTW